MPKQKYILGELEEAIMQVVWDHASLTVREVVSALRHRQVAYTTVMTVMNRLVAQRILVRKPGEGGAYTYSSRLTRQAFGAEASRAAIDELIRRYGAVAMAQFIDRLDQVPADKLAQLRRRLHDSDTS